MTTSCAIVDCSVKDGANIAQRDRKVKRWLPVGPLPEGMAFSGSLQCMICNSFYQRINRYQSEERVSERISGRGAGRFRFQPRRRKLGSKTKFRVYAAPAHQPSSCRRMTIATFQQSAFDHRHHCHHLLRRPPPRQLPSSYEAPWNCHRRRNALGLRTNFLGHQDSTQEA